MKEKFRGKAWQLFAVAAVLGIVSAIGVITYMDRVEAKLRAELTPAPEQTVGVVVATADLRAGAIIGAGNMAVRQVPAQYVHHEAVTPAQFDQIQGAMLTQDLQQGKALLQSYVDKKFAKDFSDTLIEGRRGMTIQVDELNSISGLIRPGNHIDLFVRMSARNDPDFGDETGGMGEIILPLLENVTVLATGRKQAKPNQDAYMLEVTGQIAREYDTLTLDISPREGALLALAKSQGGLVAILRNEADDSGAMFDKLKTGDLFTHAKQLLTAAKVRTKARALDNVHVTKDGRIVTADGVEIKDPNLRVTKDGLIVTKDGTVLSGRDLVVGEDGRIRTKDGKLVDTANLKTSADGHLIASDGTLINANGLTKTKGGFLVDEEGHVMTPEGKVIKGLKLTKDGRVVTADGEEVTADRVVVGKDGKVRLLDKASDGYKLDKEGNVVDVDGKKVTASELVTVDENGNVVTASGKVLQGVTVGADGKLYDSDGNEVSAKDVLIADKGYTTDSDGNVIGSDGKKVTASDLVTVDKDGTVRTKDGKVLQGVTMDKDGTLRAADGRELKAADLLVDDGLSRGKGRVLEGVTAGEAGFSPAEEAKKTPIAQKATEPKPYEVEFIVGGSGGVANTFKVIIKDKENIILNK